MGMHKLQGACIMEMPIIVLLLAANVLWYIVGWSQGFTEGKREGLIVGKTFQRVTTDAR